MKKYGIEYHYPAIKRLSGKWSVWHWYETEKQRNEAIQALRKKGPGWGMIIKEFREVER